MINDITNFENSEATIEEVIDNTISPEQLPMLHHFQKVKFTATVTIVQDPISVGKAKLTTQEFYVGDATQNCKLQMWGPNINALQQGKTYNFTNISVSQFNGRKHFTTTKETTF